MAKKKYSRKEAEVDILNSPFSFALGWAKGGKLTKAGREILMGIK